MKKKIVTLSLAVALAATAVIGGTLAYFTDTEEKENIFTVGNVEIELTEPNWDASGEEEAKTVYPGEPLAKDPTVENTGANPCFVRVSVSGLDQFGDKGDIVYLTNYVEGALHEGWVDGNDGYFYWSEPLEIGETTVALFDQIKMPVGLTGNEKAEPIVVTAEAVQAQGARPGYAAVEEMTVAEIQAWFATCMPAETPAP
ncbi:MAG TPA: SipW-dependent-type signal peptide-containing protein [Candidatus Eisenbergiella merdigallinarum]|uniref:SipW-dependent-type signal peptide-containing protein n=1 Tax=Candidatus Eisenbergiella merdigallinarum TaxID=2838552 RepID=A0A9D2SET3_9FIRM|nr:SipW-dependent-type signal peptide-containing protein [Candidatus Eisenbergiella merdigallinarum]